MLPHAALLSAVYAGMRHRTMSSYSATIGLMTPIVRLQSCPFIMQPLPQFASAWMHHTTMGSSIRSPL